MSSTHAPGVTTFVTDASSSDPDEQEHVVDPVHTGPGDSGSQPWIRRFAVHCLLVLLALVGLVVVVDRGASVITDEGAVITQTAVIADGDWTRAETWRIDRPFAEIDPDADYVPLELSDIAGDSYLPYAKHPAYPVLLLPAWEVFGHRGIMLVSAVSAWLAAIAGALIARRIRPGLEVPTLWILGVGSPLIFDAAVIMAHGLAAALLGFLVLTASTLLDRPGRPAVRGPGVLGVLAGMALLTLLLVMVRSEGFLASIALAAALGLAAVGRDADARTGIRIRPALATSAVVVAVAGVFAYLLDGRLAAALVGDGDTSPYAIQSRGSFIGGRISAFSRSILQPAAPLSMASSTLLLVACLTAIVAAVQLRRAAADRDRGEPVNWQPIVMLAGIAAICAVGRAFLEPSLIIGLIPAFPLLVVGLIGLRRIDLRPPLVRVCVITTALASLAIWGTSYAIGGGAEWGGRFYHLLLPLIVPVAVLGLDRLLHALPATSSRSVSPRTLVVGCAIVLTASIGLVWVRYSVATRDWTKLILAEGLSAAQASAPAQDDGLPVVITDVRGIPRMAWSHIGQVRYLRVPEPELLAPLLERLATTDVGTVNVVVSPLQPLPDAALQDWEVVATRGDPDTTYTFVELRRR